MSEERKEYGSLEKNGESMGEVEEQAEPGEQTAPEQPHGDEIHGAWKEIRQWTREEEPVKKFNLDKPRKKAGKGIDLADPQKGASVALIVAAILLVFLLGLTGRVERRSDEVALTMAGVEHFSETHAFTLHGLDRFREKQIRDNLRLEPPVAFAVDKLSSGDAVITLDEQTFRNVEYTVYFDVPDSDGDETLEFTINGPGMTVRLDNGSSTLGQHDPLTLVFSEQVDIYSLEENLKIEPRTAYTLSYNRNKVTITPDVEWAVSNNYQVRINAAYTSLANGKQFAEHQVLSFKVAAPKTATASETTRTPTPSIAFHSGDSFVQSEDGDMTLVFQADRLSQEVAVLVETYRMDSLQKYREQGHVYINHDIRLDSLEKLDTNAFLIENGENRFTVPSFGEGSYILSATYKDPKTKEEVEVRTSYLISPLSVYMQSSDKELLVWLNSSGEDAPLSGYEVVFTGGEDAPRGVTDSSGLLVIPTEKSYSAPSFSIYDPEGVMVYYDDTNLYADRYQNDRYYSYLFTDRTLYKPEDTVCFWGFVRPFVYNVREMPETVTVTFDEGGLDIVQEVAVNENGVFYGEIELEQIRSAQYSISTKLYFPAEEEGTVGTTHAMDYEYVSVKAFEKPQYILSAQVHDDIYGPKDEVAVTATASFYDGTPLVQYPIEAFYFDSGVNDWTKIKGLETDASGNLTFSFPANPGKGNIGAAKGVETNRYKVQIANDGEMITHVGSYAYFPSDVLIDYEVTRQGEENLSLTVRTYELDMDSPGLATYLEQEGYYYYGGSNDRLLELARGAPVDTELDLELRWKYYDSLSIRHQNRQHTPSSVPYVRFDNSFSLDFTMQDPDNMEVIRNWENQAKKITVSTQNGVAVVPDLIYMREDVEAYIDFDREVTLSAEITYKDGVDNTCSVTAYYPSAERYSRDWEEYIEEEEKEKEIVPGYSFAVVDLASGEDITPDAYYYRQVTMNVGQGAGFQLLYDSEPVETEGRLLYTVIMDGLYDSGIVAGDSFQLQYPMEYGEGVRLVAAYFDGSETRYVKQLDLNASTRSMEIDVEVTPDRAAYRPGDTVNLAVRATDYQGQGVAGNLVISVVDEAIFALSEQYINVLYDLYSSIYVNNSVTQYCSTYRDEPYVGGTYDGGKGGGGGVEFYDSYRSEFKDTALFLPVTTDGSGNSAVSFQLPDNTTSWRITTVAIGNNLRAGYAKDNIISTLPFFVSPVMTGKYIEGDDVAMLVQGHGTLLSGGDEIDYTVTLTGDGVNETLTATGEAYQALEFNFGKLPMGAYTVVSRAQYSGYADTVELPLSVIKSNLELVVHRSMDLTEVPDINAVRYPVTLTLYDESNEAFMTSINSLFGHYCMQASQRLSRFVAKRAIRQTVERGRVPSYIAEGNDSVADMQNSDGGIAPYPGSASDLSATTYVLLVAKDQFNLNSMAAYYRGYLSGGGRTFDKRIATAYLGLGAIGDIEAGELRGALKIAEEAGVDTDVRAYLIAAMAYLADANMDDELAREAYELYENELHTEVSGANNGRRKSLEWERDAAAIWIAASKVGHEDADMLSIYFGSAGWRYRTLFEAMIYVTNYDRPVTSSSYSYTVKGETVQGTFSAAYGGMHTVVLSRSDLESFRINSASDSVRAVAYYVGEPTEFGLEQSEEMGIHKKIRQLDGNTYEVTLTILLSENAPTGEYDISDWVPSNSRLYSYDRQHVANSDETIHFDSTSEGQNLYISFNNPSESAKTILYTYRIRQTFQAESALDTVYMIHGDSGENANSDKSTFQPKMNVEESLVIRAGDEPEEAAGDVEEQEAQTAQEEEPEEEEAQGE